MNTVNNAITAMAVSIMLTCTPAAFASEDDVRISFDGGGFSTASPDLFQGKADLSPGDVFSTRICLANESSTPQLFLLSLEVPDVLSSEGQTLLESATLTMTASDGYRYYEGPLAGNLLRDNVELEACEPGETVELDVKITVPSELGNDYAMSKDMLHWRFTALPIVDEAPIGGPGSVFDKTGYDLRAPVALAASLALAGVAMLVAGVRRRGR